MASEVTDPQARVNALLDTLDEIRAFLSDRGMATEWSRFASVASAASGEESAARVLRSSWRAYVHSAGHRDGIADLYVTTADGGVDREASRALDALKDRIAAVLGEV